MPSNDAASMDPAIEPFDPLSDGHMSCPYDYWGRARHNNPVFFSEEHDLWFVTRFEDVLAALKDSRRFSSEDVNTPAVPLPPEIQEILARGPGNDYLVSNVDPPEHTPIRRAVNKALTRRAVSGLDDRITAIANELIDEFVDDGRVELHARFAHTFPANVVGDVLGVPREDLPMVMQWGHDWVTILSGTAPIEALRDAAEGFVASQEYWQVALEERKHNPRPDLLTAFVEAFEEDPALNLTFRQMANVPLATMAAAHETTAQAICSGIVLLLSNEEQVERVLADPKVLERAVDEILRSEPPVQMNVRTAHEDVEIGGARIPAGAKMMLVYGSANHDERHFGQSVEDFDVDREDVSDHLAFAKGIHFCPGSPLARREIAIGLGRLFDRLPNLRFAPGGDSIVPLPHFWLRGYEQVHVEWDVP